MAGGRPIDRRADTACRKRSKIMSGNHTRPARGLLLVLTATLAALAVACSGGAANSSAGTANAASAKSSAPVSAAPAGAAAAAATPPASTGDPEKDLVAKGKVIFQQTAGGVGCQLCHGMTGKGDGSANLGAPNIQGADISKIRGALEGGVPVMQFIKLSDDELQAVAAFVKSLAGQ